MPDRPTNAAHTAALAAPFRPRRPSSPAGLTVTMLAAAAAACLTVAAHPQDAEAQRRYATIDSLRHVQSVVPRSGPPGTEVEIYTENLPPQAKIHVGVGAMRAGFEALAEATQEMWGEVSATVRIPRYATWERPIVFIVFNGVFSPIGISDPFHVTDDRGWVRRVGRITDEGLECPTLRDADQYMYALAGDLADLGDLKPGDDVAVEGTVTVEGTATESSPCGGADQIDVVRWERTP